MPQEPIGEEQILAALLGVSEMVAEITDVDELLESIVRIAPSLLRVDRCAVLRYNPSSRSFGSAAAFAPHDRASAFANLSIPEADMPRLSQRILRLRLPALVKSTGELSLPTAVAKRLGVRSALLVPLSCRGRVLGCLWLDDSMGSHYFTSKEINIVQGIGTLLALALDAADRDRSEVRADRRFEALARALSDGVIRLDTDLRISSMDAAAEDLLGWNTGEVRGRRVVEVLDITEAEAAMAWRRADGVPAPATKELSLRGHDGRRVTCDVLMVPVRAADGVLDQVLYVLRNLGGAKGVEARAMDALKQLAIAQAEPRPE